MSIAPLCYREDPWLYQGGYVKGPQKLSREGAKLRSWARHQADCKTCQHEDWYDPHPPRLCRIGRSLFAAWKKQAVTGWPQREEAA